MIGLYNCLITAPITLSNNNIVVCAKKAVYALTNLRVLFFILTV